MDRNLILITTELLLAALIVVQLPESALAASDGSITPQAQVSAQPAVPSAPPLELPAPGTLGAVFVATEIGRRAELIKLGYALYGSINEAVRISEPGSTIYVTAGKYYENLQLFALSDLSILCEEGTTLIANNDSHCVELSGCNNIAIRNLDAVHAIGENPCYHNCYVISECTNVLIDYCDISGCGYTGIAVYGYESLLKNVRAEYCAIHDCQIGIEDYSFGELTLTGNVIWNCPLEIASPESEYAESESNEPPAEPEVPNVKPESLPQPPLAVLPPATTDKLIVVAQDEALRRELSGKSYWCVPSIQRALDAADEGSTIFITKGEYHENLMLIGLHNIKMVGEEGTLVVADNDDHVCFIQECQSIQIRNVDVVHEVGEDPCLQNCFVIWDAQDVLIEYCDISGCGYIGVEVLGNGAPQNIKVQYCTIHDCQVAYYDVNGNVLNIEDNALWNIQTVSWSLD